MQQILWAEIFLKAAAGIILIIAPLTALAIAGLQKPDQGFWPRLLGAMLLGVAAGIWIGLQFPAVKGTIGPAGLIPINLLAAATMLAALVLGHGAPTRRGRLLVAAAGVLLLALAFLEIAHA